MDKQTRPNYPSRRLYNPTKSNLSEIGTKYTRQKDIVKNRKGLSKKPEDSAFNYDTNEEEKFGMPTKGTGLYKSTGLHDFTIVEFEKMKERIKILEAQNQQKDDTIKKLKVENGRLRAHRNVLEGKVKGFQIEKARNGSNSNNSSSDHNSSHPINSAWNAARANRPAGKFLIRICLTVDYSKRKLWRCKRIR